MLQILFSVRSERQFMEQTQYNMLFRWFTDLAMDDAVWMPTVTDPDSKLYRKGKTASELRHSNDWS